MRMQFVSKIEGNLRSFKNIFTRRRTSCVLDGSYASVFKGKSMNFDELREYVAGDDVKDIDWKATSRSGKVLVRQYVAEKKHNVMFLLDSNRRMLGSTKSHEEKRTLAIMAAGSLALMVNRNADYVGMTFMDGTKLKHHPFRTGLANIEIMLEEYYRSVRENNASDLNKTIEYILKSYNRKMVIFLVSDIQGFHDISDQNLRRLKANHDVLALTMNDADFAKGKLYDLTDDHYVDDFFLKDKKLCRLIAKRKEELSEENEERFKVHGIVQAEFDNSPELEKDLIEMLSRHKFEKR